MKQVIIIRKDLKMRRGKEIAQGAHASMKNVVENMNDDYVKEWLAGSFAKVTLQINSEEELVSLIEKADNHGLIANVIVDSGRTEFHGEPTKTCGAIGPAPEKDIDRITGHLKLY